VIDEGVTARIVDHIDHARIAVAKVAALDRCKVRRHFDERFTARRMATDYIRVYCSLVTRAATTVRGIKSRSTEALNGFHLVGDAERDRHQAAGKSY